MMATADRTKAALPKETDVLVIGAGPVGLSVAVQLNKAGIKAIVAERRRSLSLHPKANGIFSRTMEIFRQWGLSEKIVDAGLPPEQCLGFVWTTRIAGIELGSIRFASDVDGLRSEYARHSPEIPCFIPQDLVERLLGAELGDDDPVSVKLGAQAVAIQQDDTGATVTFRMTDGSVQSVRAKYVVAADGSRSTMRGLLEIPEEGVQPWGESLNIYFESEEFGKLRGNRPYQLWWVVNADVRGAFWPVSHKNRWIFTPEGVPGVAEDYYTPDICAEMIRKGAGADVDINILSASVWQHEMAIAKDWKRGRVFLAGDAAHRFPPHGGFGMNSGIQDAQNLGWKLISVLKGRAGPLLLDSYEAERKPVAETNAAQTLRNTELVKETGWFVPNPAELAVIELPEGKTVRDRISAAVPRQSASIESLGQQFGAVYASSAVLHDGSDRPISSVSEYLVSATPGARAPHLWIQDEQGGTKSILDLFEFDSFVLLTTDNGDGWRIAAKRLAVRARMKIPNYSIGEAKCDFRCESFAREYGIESHGAVLIRPDGHVAWRSRGIQGDAEQVLGEALGSLFSIDLEDAGSVALNAQQA
jgi:putative polyketide hydroxylase